MDGRTTAFVRAIFFCLGCLTAAPRSAAEAQVPATEATRISIEAATVDGGGKWIRSETELVRNYPISAAALRSVLEDFEAYPRFLPRLARTTVLDRKSASTTIRQRYEISILGYRYPTEYDLTLEEDAQPTPGRWSLSWRLAGSDGSIGESRGSWTLESYTDENGRACTRLTHRNVGAVRKRFPLQLSVMRAVAERELARSVDAVYAEALRRSEALAATD
jgi:ribosome-associated toxin RatA of RatAB toxin-antitoxin module